MSNIASSLDYFLHKNKCFSFAERKKKYLNKLDTFVIDAMSINAIVSTLVLLLRTEK